MLFTYIFLLGFFISTAVCKEESASEGPNVEEEEQPQESVASSTPTTTTTTTTPGAVNSRAKRSTSPQTKTNDAPDPNATKAKGKSGFAGKAKKFAAKVAKGTQKAAKATAGAAKNMKKKIVKKK